MGVILRAHPAACEVTIIAINKHTNYVTLIKINTKNYRNNEHFFGILIKHIYVTRNCQIVKIAKLHNWKL